MPHFYRFRSTDNLLDRFHELENQEIYFCPPEDLNDPIEGFKDLFWRGDEIVWRNLLRHYLLCLMRSFLIAAAVGPESDPVPSRDVVLGSKDGLPSEQLRIVYEQICNKFFAAPRVVELPGILARYPYPLRRNGLAFCLRNAHALGLNCVIEELQRAKLFPSEFGIPASADAASELITAMMVALERQTVNDEHLDPAVFEIGFFVGDLMLRQVVLANYTRADNQVARSWLPLFQSFPETYIDQLDHLVYSEWFVSCFVCEPTHAAMWGHYGDSHRGVCLKFKSAEDATWRPTIRLHGVTGAYAGPNGSGPSYGDRPFVFEEMRYVPRFVEVDFFRSIGVLPIPTLRAEWYSDTEGNVSSSADKIFTDPDEWRREYWDIFQSISHSKFKDWEYEKEYRLLLTSAAGLINDRSKRKWKYNFSDLEGIIFGLKTSRADKLRIIEIIEAQCKASGRQNFEFSQAAYDPSTGTFATHTLDALRFD